MEIVPAPLVLSFLKKEKIAKDTYSFYFARSEDSNFEFLAGQYIRVLLDLPAEDHRGRSRMFTICSSPEQKEFIMITTKVSDHPSIFKQKMMSFKKGERVNFFGPMGGFILPATSGSPLVFFAGGMGITPFHSMLLYAGKVNYPASITFFVSFNAVEEIIFYDTLTNLSKNHKNIKVIYTVSHPEKSTKIWNGEMGRISEELIKKHLDDIFSPTYFISGPPIMVGSMLDLLEEMKVPSEKIREEQLTGY